MSTSIETIKSELINQKSEITKKGGTVNVHNTNPTPTEITEAIKTIPYFDASAATALESDVLKDKTFYGPSGLLSTGTLNMISAEDLQLLFNNYTNDTTPITFYVPNGTLKTRPYYFASTPTYMNLYLNSELQEIGDHSFWHCGNTTIMNFNDMQNLTKVDTYGLAHVKGVDLSNLPSCITTVGSYGFNETSYFNTSIKIPGTITSLGENAFAGTVNCRGTLTSVDLSECNLTLPRCVFMFNVFPNYDYVTPTHLPTVTNNFMYNGGPRSVTIKSHITRVGAYCFGNNNTDPSEYNILRTIVIEGETPCTYDNFCFGPFQARASTKIYVPDQSIEAYKAVANLKIYSNINIIYPMSEKP